MTSLASILTRNEFTNLSASERYDILMGSVTIPGPTELYHWNGVLDQLILRTEAMGGPGNGLTPEDVAVAADTLKGMPVGYETLDKLLTTGCILSSPAFRVQVMLMEVLEPPNAKKILDAILEIGADTTQPAWKVTYGLTEEPTLEQVERETNKMGLMHLAQRGWATVIAGILDGTLDDNDKITQAFGGRV